MNTGIPFFSLKNLLPALLLAAVLGMNACSAPEPQDVLIETDMGNMRLRLSDETPRHRDNFISLVKKGYYDGLLFHRVIRDFMIQAGDPDSKTAAPADMLGKGGPGYDLKAEIKLPLVRGALAAARLPDPVNPDKKSNGSQFFIVQGTPHTAESIQMWEKQRELYLRPEHREQYIRLGGLPQLDGQYTVFGQVIEGLDALDRISAVACDGNDRPLSNITIRRMTLVKR